jgi:hypothetical protein
MGVSKLLIVVKHNYEWDERLLFGDDRISQMRQGRTTAPQRIRRTVHPFAGSQAPTMKKPRRSGVFKLVGVR